MASSPNSLLVAIALMSAAALAGCTSSPDDAESDDQPGTATTPGTKQGPPIGEPGGTGNVSRPITRPELVECSKLIASHFLERTFVQDMLPPGFSPSSIIPGTAMINVEYFECESLIANNETVMDSVTGAQVLAFVSVPEDKQTNGVSDVFVLEWFMDNDRFVHDFLAPLGVQATAGQVVVDQVSGETKLMVDGALLYETRVLHRTGHVQDSPFNRKLHYVNDDGVASMFGNATQRYSDMLPTSGVTFVHGGILSSLPQAAAGALTAATGYSTVSMYFEPSAT